MGFSHLTLSMERTFERRGGRSFLGKPRKKQAAVETRKGRKSQRWTGGDPEVGR